VQLSIKNNPSILQIIYVQRSLLIEQESSQKTVASKPLFILADELLSEMWLKSLLDLEVIKSSWKELAIQMLAIIPHLLNHVKSE
jgi:hypothetical protein